MSIRFSSIARIALIAGVVCFATSCSTGIFFADDNQEGHVGFLSVTQYSNVSDVLIMKKGAAPKLTDAVDSEPQTIAEIGEPTPLSAVVKTDTLLKNDTAMANKAPRYDIPIIEAKTQPVAHSKFVSSPR